MLSANQHEADQQCTETDVIRQRPVEVTMEEDCGISDTLSPPQDRPSNRILDFQDFMTRKFSLGPNSDSKTAYNALIKLEKEFPPKDG